MPKPSLRNQAARDRLVEDNIRLAYFAAGKYHRKLPDSVARSYTIDDAISDAMLGLIRAAELYDDQIGKFSTYACLWSLQHMLRGSRDSQIVHVPCHQKVKLSFRTIDPREDWESILGVSDDDPGTDLDREVRAAIQGLDPRRRAIVRLRMHGLTLHAISRMMGVTRERVRQMESQAHHRLRQQLSGGE